MFDVEGFILVGGQSRRMGRDKAELRIGGELVPARIASALAAVTSHVSLVGARKQYGELNLPNIPDVHPGWGALGGIHAALTAAKADWVVVVACDLPFVTRELFERLRSFIAGPADAVVRGEGLDAASDPGVSGEAFNVASDAVLRDHAFEDGLDEVVSVKNVTLTPAAGLLPSAAIRAEVEKLREQAAVDAVVPVQEDGRPQPVCAFYRVATCLPELETLIAAGEHTPRALLSCVQTRYVEFSELSDLPAANRFFINVNTPEDFESAEKELRRLLSE